MLPIMNISEEMKMETKQHKLRKLVYIEPVHDLEIQIQAAENKYIHLHQALSFTRRK